MSWYNNSKELPGFIVSSVVFWIDWRLRRSGHALASFPRPPLHLSDFDPHQARLFSLSSLRKALPRRDYLESLVRMLPYLVLQRLHLPIIT